MNFILNVYLAIATAIALAYPFVSIVNLIGLALAFIPEESRKSNLTSLREENKLDGYSDWQVIALLILLAFCPYFNLALFSSTLAVTVQQLTWWLEPFDKRKG